MLCCKKINVVFRKIHFCHFVLMHDTCIYICGMFLDHYFNLPLCHLTKHRSHRKWAAVPSKNSFPILSCDSCIIVIQQKTDFIFRTARVIHIYENVKHYNKIVLWKIGQDKIFTTITLSYCLPPSDTKSNEMLRKKLVSIKKTHFSGKICGSKIINDEHVSRLYNYACRDHRQAII